MFRTVFPSIIRSSRLYIQQQAYVKQILLSACWWTDRRSSRLYILQQAYDMIWYIFNCNWVETRWQQYSTHLHTHTHNTQNNTIDTKQYTEQHNSLIRNSAGRAPSLRGVPWHLPYNWGKSTGKPVLRIHLFIYVFITSQQHQLQICFLVAM